MKYRANPVNVDAFRILSVDAPSHDGSRLILHEEGQILARREMTARMEPVPGDYLVVQEDGYTYLNPKEVFERKYSPAAPESNDGGLKILLAIAGKSEAIRVTHRPDKSCLFETSPGVPVFECTAKLADAPAALQQYAIQPILIAISEAVGKHIREALDKH